MQKSGLNFPNISHYVSEVRKILVLQCSHSQDTAELCNIKEDILSTINNIPEEIATWTLRMKKTFILNGLLFSVKFFCPELHTLTPSMRHVDP